MPTIIANEGYLRVRSLIVHNNRSGFGSDAIFEFERFLVRPGDECVLRVLDEGESIEHALRDASSFDLVIPSGGDGTVANALDALAGRDIPTCIFPSGTANLLFANLGNAMEPQAMAHACHELTCFRGDLGTMSWHTDGGSNHARGFALMAGMGFDAQLMRAALPNKRRMGEAAYFAAAFSNLHPTMLHFTIDCDGTVCERDGISCMVANNAMMQGEIEIVSDCRMDDGKLDVIVLEASEAAGLLRPIFAGVLDRTGKSIGRPHIEHFRGSRKSVQSDSSMPMQIDGEVIEGCTHGFSAQVRPASTRLTIDHASPYHTSARLVRGTVDVHGGR